jgi:hypothetical protein
MDNKRIKFWWQYLVQVHDSTYSNPRLAGIQASGIPIQPTKMSRIFIYFYWKTNLRCAHARHAVFLIAATSSATRRLPTRTFIVEAYWVFFTHQSAVVKEVSRGGTGAKTYCLDILLGFCKIFSYATGRFVIPADATPHTFRIAGSLLRKIRSVLSKMEHMGRQAGRQTDRQTDSRQTDR